MPYDEWSYAAVIALGILVIVLFLFLIIEYRRKKPTKEEWKPSIPQSESRWPFTVRRTVAYNEVKDAKDKLRIMDIEREILSYAIRRLYEVHAEGKITEEERDRLCQKYREDLERIKDEISRGESIIALSELEKMQEDLLKLFNERFDELNRRIEELRERSGTKPAEPIKKVEETPASAPPPKPPETETPPSKKRTETTREKAPPEKSEAERKVEQIVAEVEKVLERIEQMEVEE